MIRNLKTTCTATTLFFVVAAGTVEAQPDDAPAFQLAIRNLIELECGDCDGIALGDISGDGKTDILTSNGKGGATFWYRQGDTPDQWTRHPIFTIEESPREVEGNDLGDFNGDGRLEAVSLDQPNGRIYLHQQPAGDPTGEWKTVVLQSDRPYLQASLVTDVDGDGVADLIYTWEGDAEGRGGVHWLKLTGTDLLDPEHWTDYPMIQHESAWWLAPKRADLNSNGTETDIVFTARNIPRRNPGASPGVFWLEEPEDVTQTWTLHIIDDSLNHPLHVDLGDLSGNGHGKDVVVGGFDTRSIFWYDFSDDWKRHELPLPEMLNGGTPNRVWNIKTARFRGERDGILAPVMEGNRGALLFYEFIDGRYLPNNLMPIDYPHPMDDRIILHDLDGDGLEEAFVPDSGPGVDRLILFKFQWGNDGN